MLAVACALCAVSKAYVPCREPGVAETLRVLKSQTLQDVIMRALSEVLVFGLHTPVIWEGLKGA